MPESRRSTRRTACKQIGWLVASLAGLVTTAGSSSAASTADRSRGVTPDDGVGSAPALARSPSDPVDHRGAIDTRKLEVYPGVVDRIVDETFVVILLEADGKVVDELVEPRENLPPVAESDRVIVILEDGERRSVIPLSTARQGPSQGPEA